MSHMELSRNIRRGHNYGKRLFVRVDIGSESAAFFPHLIDALLKVLRVVCFRHILFHVHTFLSLSLFLAARRLPAPAFTAGGFHLLSIKKPSDIHQRTKHFRGTTFVLRTESEALIIKPKLEKQPSSGNFP